MLFHIGSLIGRRRQQIAGQELVGTVINNVHPQGKHGLIQVRIRDLHEGWADKDIPWQRAREGFGSGDKAITNVKIPAIGTKVFSRAEDNTQYHMTYREGPSSEDKHNKNFINEDYPWIYGSEDTAGNLETQNTKDGKNEYTYTHQSGSKVHIDNDGNMHYVAAKKLILHGKEGVEIVSGEDMKIHAKRDIDTRAERDTYNQAKRYVRKRAGVQYRTHPVPDTIDPAPLDPDSPAETKARERPNPNMKV